MGDLVSSGVAVIAGLRLGVNYREHIRIGLRSRRVSPLMRQPPGRDGKLSTKYAPLESEDLEENRHGLEYIRDPKSNSQQDYWNTC